MNSENSKHEHRALPRLMGSAFELIVVHEDAEKADNFLKIGIAEIKRIEQLLSEFVSTSATSIINQNAGIQPVKVNLEVFTLLTRCRQLSRLTQGAFDITVGPLKKIYSFKKERFQLPNEMQIKATLNQVGFQHLVLNESKQSAFLSKPNMHLSFAAIGKGYAADCVKKIWLKAGLSSGVINASGDMTSFGSRANGSPWNLGIPNPDTKKNIQFHLPMSNLSVATSGDYEQFFIHQDTRYSHTIHPKSGYPTTGIKSVSIFSPKAELSDALATAIFVMGVDIGLHFIDQLPQTHCIIIDDQNKSWFSKNIKQKEMKKPKLKKMRVMSLAILFVMTSLLSFSCSPVAPYERFYLNDPEMQLGQNSAEGFENYIVTIREGATPASGAKTSGGCGCN